MQAIASSRFRFWLLWLAAFLLSGCATTKFQTIPSKCVYPLVPVAGYTKALTGDEPLANAKIVRLENGEVISTNSEGQFSLCAYPGSKITLELSKEDPVILENYQTTQSGTFRVPKSGMFNRNNEITFQVPRSITYKTLKFMVLQGQKIQLLPHTCVLATTVTAFGKTLADAPQGEPDAKIIIWHKNKIVKNLQLFYFGIIFNKTNPLDINKDVTSEDGGVVVYNLLPSRELYYISAQKPGKKFTTESFLCRSGAFINLSPPHGPTVENP